MQTQTKDLLSIMQDLNNQTLPPTPNKHLPSIHHNFISTFRAEIKKKHNLSTHNFHKLKKILQKDYQSFLTFSFTKNENIVIGRAFMKIKIIKKQELIEFLVLQKNIIVLYSYLCLQTKVNVQNVVNLLKEILNNNTTPVVLDILKLLLVVFRNYNKWFDRDLEMYCRSSGHGICKEIVDEIDGK